MQDGFSFSGAHRVAKVDLVMLAMQLITVSCHKHPSRNGCHP
jgi:hypothetical protein